MPHSVPLDATTKVLLTLSALSVPVTLTHSIEDLDASIHRDFGLGLLTAAYLLSLGYTTQLLGAILSARAHRGGHLLNLVVAVIWLVGSVGDHIDDLLFAEDYRHGAVSKVLELGIMVIGTAWALVAIWALRRSLHKDESRTDD